MASSAYAEYRIGVTRCLVMDTIERAAEPEMHRREIEMADGRYLLFYTFETAATVVESISENQDDEGDR